VLKRGYSLCHLPEDGKVITRASQLQDKSRIRLEMYDGAALAQVDKVEMSS